MPLRRQKVSRKAVFVKRTHCVVMFLALLDILQVLKISGHLLKYSTRVFWHRV